MRNIFRLFRDRPITDSDIKKERKLMELEKLHFGHYILYHERQTREYQIFLRAVKEMDL